jgi:dihydroxycyclohexadiene carboxylate dehydrogenase
MAEAGGTRFSGRNAVVTGAGQGLGRAVAEQLAREGARVFLVDRAPHQVDEVKAGIAANGGKADVLCADLESYDEVKRLFATVASMVPTLDVSVHNVGGTIWIKPYWEYQPKEIEKEISRSLWTTLWCCYEAVPIMRRQGKGAIVNVGSVVTRGDLYRVPYAVAKAGIHAATMCLANELGDCGVRVNCVAPGGLDNADRVVPRNDQPLSDKEKGWLNEVYQETIARTPLNRLGRAKEVAAAICFLASDEASYITGQTLSAAGGGTA